MNEVQTNNRQGMDNKAADIVQGEIFVVLTNKVMNEAR